MYIELPNEISDVLSRLHTEGFEGYVVGGCVRDALLGKTPGDYDITTSALPPEIKKCFAEYKTVDTGLRHGTVTVVTNGMNVEITTYRIDGKYVDNRHPDSVSFTGNIADDLSRRDFTVNAMAYSPATGLVDLFDGQKHLKEKKLVCVGDPVVRFHEDGLRILRALRFASVLDFEIDSGTADAVHSCAQLLQNISAERIFTEIKKLLCGDGVKKILLGFSDVLCACVPEIAQVSDSGQLPRAALAVEKLPLKSHLRLAALLCQCADNRELSAQRAMSALRCLKADNRTAQRVCTLIRLCGSDTLPVPKNARRLAAVAGFECARETLLLLSALESDSPEKLCELREMSSLLDTVQREKQCISVQQLAVKGKDLINYGIEPGEHMGDILNELFSQVLDGTLENDRRVLISEAQRLYSQV